MLYGGVRIAGKPDLANVAVLDRLPIPFIQRAHRLGIAISREHFWELSSKFRGQVKELEKDIQSYLPPDRLAYFNAESARIEAEEGDASFNAASSEQIGALLFETLGLGRDKKLKRTSAGRISTGKRQLELIRLEHPVVPKVLRHRELSKLISTYCDSLPKLARFHPRSACCPVCELPHDSDQWRVHGEMGTTRADTGRINHKNPNLGNIPTRTEDGQDVQAGFIAPPGKRLVHRDLSQIELCDLAHLANAESMIEVYQAGGDIHDNTGRKVFRLAEDVKPDKIKHRMPSKRCNFSIMNGTTNKGLYLQLVMDYGSGGIPVPDWLTEEWCGDFIKKWLETYPEVLDYFDRMHYRARRYGMVWDMFGRVKLIPEVKSTHSWIREAGLRYAQNMPVTSSSAGKLKLSMGRAEEMMLDMYDEGCGVWVYPLLTIHDAIKVEADEEVAEDVLEMLGVAMNGCMQDVDTGEHCFRVPIKSDGSVTERWEK